MRLVKPCFKGFEFAKCNRVGTLQVSVKFDKMGNDEFGKIVGQINSEIDLLRILWE